MTVGDQNDNSPKFNQNPYTFYIREDASLSQLVGVVSATDKDIGVNGRLRYSILSGSGKDDFLLDANTGQVKVRRNLDFERQTGYVTVCSERSFNGLRLKHFFEMMILQFF